MIKWELTMEEANLALSLLAKAPFEQVFQLIAKLQQQAQVENKENHSESE